MQYATYPMGITHHRYYATYLHTGAALLLLFRLPYSHAHTYCNNQILDQLRRELRA